jgi:hypothetical protein
MLPVLLYVLAYPWWMEWDFQHFLILFYIPFGVVYGGYVWVKPTDNLTKYIIFTPIAFVLYLLLLFSVFGAQDGHFRDTLYFLPTFIVLSIPFVFVGGGAYVVLCLLILEGFKKWGSSPKKS